MLGYAFAFLAALANAASSVLQRRAGQDEQEKREMTFRLVIDLVRKPVWLFGILAVTAGFLLQATALKYGGLAAVEPVLAIELPITVVLASRFLGEPLGRNQALSIAAMTVGLAGLLYFLSPHGGHPSSVTWWRWTLALAAGYAVIGMLVIAGRRTRHDLARSAFYGAATGCGFGVTAALMKGMTNQLQHGFLTVFWSWQTYLMIATGAASMYLLQNAVAAGKLVAAQPGFTLADPVVAILWGTLVFGESVQKGLFMLLAVLSFVLMVASVVALSRAEQGQEGDSSSEGAPRDQAERVSRSST